MRISDWSSDVCSSDLAAESCVAAIAAAGGRAIAVKGDVALPETASDFVAKAVDAFGRVDVMVSNAGICPFHAFLDMPAETFERTQRVNMHGASYMCQAAARQLVGPGDGGAIVPVSWISAAGGGGVSTALPPTKRT